MKKNMTFEDIGLNFLHQEQILKLEQITFSLAQNNPVLVKNFQQNFKTLKDAYSSLRRYFDYQGLPPFEGKDTRGEYLEIAYETFSELNSRFPIEMSTIHSLGCLDFTEHHVKLYQLLLPFFGKAGMSLSIKNLTLN